MRLVLKNFRLVDEETDTPGGVIIEDGIISTVLPGRSPEEDAAAMIIDGSRLLPSGGPPVLMPAFVDLHAHFREPAFSEKETLLPAEVLESASLAAAAGGFGTVVCMANTNPAIDTIEKAAALKDRTDALGLVDLYPVISLTKGMEGKELSGIAGLPPRSGIMMLSEDGKDLASDDLFLAAMKEAKRLGIPISCHCDLGSEGSAVRRVIELGKKASCRIHIAHVSTKEALAAIGRAKAEITALAAAEAGGFSLSCEAMPHNLCLNNEDAVKLGEKTWGRVNPPLRSEEDRKALIGAVADGTIDIIATDHAPHSQAGKEAGAPGFSGFETAFAAVFTELVRGSVIDLKRLSSLMSAGPARLLSANSQKRGRVLPGFRADLVMVDTEASWIVDPLTFKSRGKNSPFAGRRLCGKILMTLRSGRVVFES